MFDHRHRFDNPIPLDKRLTAYVDRIARILTDGNTFGYLRVSLETIAETTGQLWRKVHHQPKEVLRWEVVIISADQEPAEYLDGEYEESEAIQELEARKFNLRGESYTLDWLDEKETQSVQNSFFSNAE